ncbi:MAG: hypothetical protein GC155_13670 [Alphaproteobacteria bacterium]|nr:hypothetical protein [Alphaproteobacteria bacterium]
MRARSLRWRIGVGAAFAVALASAADGQTPPPVNAPVIPPAERPIPAPDIAPLPIPSPVLAPPVTSEPTPAPAYPRERRTSPGSSGARPDSLDSSEESVSGSTAGHSYDPCQHNNPPSYCKVE